jgi:hypothetical protein
MLRWEANFQIPNSGVQAKEVYAVVDKDRKTIKFYADRENLIHIFDKSYDIPTGVDSYGYLLSLDEFKEYEKI